MSEPALARLPAGQHGVHLLGNQLRSLLRLPELARPEPGDAPEPGCAASALAESSTRGAAMATLSTARPSRLPLATGAAAAVLLGALLATGLRAPRTAPSRPAAAHPVPAQPLRVTHSKLPPIGTMLTLRPGAVLTGWSEPYETMASCRAMTPLSMRGPAALMLMASSAYDVTLGLAPGGTESTDFRDLNGGARRDCGRTLHVSLRDIATLVRHHALRAASATSSGIVTIR